MALDDVMIKDNYFLFWDGFLSQWYPCKFNVNGTDYNCCEQYMMAMKAKTFGDEKRLQLIMETESPYLQKKLGRQVENFDEKKWDDLCQDVVLVGNMAKFTQNPDLKAKILETGDKIIVEASPYDKVWGCGLSQDDPKILDPKNWTGKNLLGECLMKVRTIIKSANL